MGSAGQPQLLEQLAKMRSDYVARVQRWAGGRSLAEDVVQDAFARAAAAAGRLRDPSQVDEWFFRVLRSAYVDHRRRANVRRRLHAEVAAELEVARQAVPDAPELACACIRHGLLALRPEYRRALEIFELGGKSLAELGSSLGITANNAGVRVHRARRALARVTRACCHGCRASADGCSCDAMTNAG